MPSLAARSPHQRFSTLTEEEKLSLERQPEATKSKKRSKTTDSCLQCHILGLKCSFTSGYQLLNPEIIQIGKCSRYLRSKEGFCIIYSHELKPWLSPGIEDTDLRERIEKLEEKTLETLRSPPPLPHSEAEKGLVKREGLWRWPKYLKQLEEKVNFAKKTGNLYSLVY